MSAASVVNSNVQVFYYWLYGGIGSFLVSQPQ